MGLAPGGRMKQEIFDDPHSFDMWDTRASGPLLRSHHQLAGVEGHHWRGAPHDAAHFTEYQDAGLPWFDWSGGDREALEGAKKLADLKTVKGVGEEKGEHPLPRTSRWKIPS